MSSAQVTAVLVHGAWTDSSIWSKVILLLAQVGMRSVAPVLPLTSLADDVAALERTLARLEGEVIVVAHCYGGTVVSQLSDKVFRAVIYIAALTPQPSECAADLLRRDSPSSGSMKLRPDASGWVWLPEEFSRLSLAQHSTLGERRVLAAGSRPMSIACLNARVQKVAVMRSPAWFLIAGDDRILSKRSQMFFAERLCINKQVAQVDHVTSLSAPEVVLRIILEATYRTRSI